MKDQEIDALKQQVYILWILCLVGKRKREE